MSDSTATLRAIVARLIRRELARMGILIAAEYRVVTQTGPFVELQIVRKAAGLPDTSRVVSRPPAGISTTYRLGSSVLVSFVGGDPSRPFIVAGPEAGSSTPPVLAIDADEIDMGQAIATVVRDGDTVSISPGNGSGPVSGILSITLGQVPPGGIIPVKSKVKA